MSEVQGFHVNTAIQAAVRDRLDEINNQFVRQALLLSDGQLEEFKIYPDQPSYRRTIRTIGMRSRKDKQVNLAEFFSVLANAPEALDSVWKILAKRSKDAWRLVEDLRDADIFKIEAWAHRTSNQLSFINAFTRLLMARAPLNRNSANLQENEEFLALIQESQKLNSLVIPSQLELQSWFDEVLNAFNTFSVVENDAPRGFGQVRRDSQRVYVNAWMQFTKTHVGEIWSRAIEIAKDPTNREFLKLRDRNSANYWHTVSPERHPKSRADTSKNQVAQLFMAPSIPSAAITLELKAIDLPAIGASKSFVSVSDARTGLEDWLVSLQGLFGGQKSEWSMVLSIQTQGIKNEISVSAPTVQKLLPQAISALKILAED